MLFTQVTAIGCSSSSYPAFAAIRNGVLYRRVVQTRSAWSSTWITSGRYAVRTTSSTNSPSTL